VVVVVVVVVVIVVVVVVVVVVVEDENTIVSPILSGMTVSTWYQLALLTVVVVVVVVIVVEVVVVVVVVGGPEVVVVVVLGSSRGSPMVWTDIIAGFRAKKKGSLEKSISFIAVANAPCSILVTTNFRSHRLATARARVLPTTSTSKTVVIVDQCCNLLVNWRACSFNVSPCL
jgi:hypothetical protein